MKRKEQLKKLRATSKEDLTKRLVELSQELMNLRFRKRAGQLTNSAQILNAKREVARVKTLLTSQQQATN